MKKVNNKIKTIHYVAPQVWVWRKNRVKKIKKFIDHMLLLFNFEKKYFDEENIKSTFVGHPLIEKKENVITTLDNLISKDKKIISLFPGSRKQEINKNFNESEGATTYSLSKRLAEQKCKWVNLTISDLFVLGADQVLDFNNDQINKPNNLEEARFIMTKLQGQTHLLHSAVCVSKNGSMIWNYHETSTLKMKTISPKDLELYLEDVGIELMQKYGVYQIEEGGLELFESEINSDDLLTLDMNCTLDVISPTSSSLQMYPNPVSFILTVDLGDLNGVNTTIKLYDSSSKLVFEKQSTSTLTIDVSSFAKGLYTLELSTSDKVLRSQVVIE